MEASDYAKLGIKAVRNVAISAWKPALIFTKAKGSTIWLNDKPYLDFASGPGVSNIGYNHPAVLNAVKEVLDNDEAGWSGNMYLNKYQVMLAEKLSAITPGKYDKQVFFSNSGGEAVEAAILACLKARPERRGMVTFAGDFHGRLGFCRTATSSKPLHVEGLNGGINRAFYLIFPSENPETMAKKEFLDCIQTSRQYLRYVQSSIGPFIKEINFALLELVQGEGGINVAKKRMMQVLIQYLHENQVTVIIDEVQTGLGRTGHMWASDFYEVEPDIMTVAKALSGGVIPIGATIFRSGFGYRKRAEHCNTFGGYPQACAAGLKSLEIVESENLAQASHEMGLVLRGGLWEARSNSLKAQELVSDISGLGLMSRMTFTDAKTRDKVVEEAMNRGLLLMSTGEQSTRLMPPLIITYDEIKKATEILMKAIETHS
ncbi:MAG: 4-aminobutyrate aminotransferase [Parcubacteria group bacterium Gr01-1014_3]|nr:MAG: 4-aminobutyrate aminotransferase [Parcubacteria group bacterium Gr01-1014_3]